MPSNSDLQQRRVAAVSRSVSNATAIYIQRARNAELWMRKAVGTSILPPALLF